MPNRGIRAESMGPGGGWIVKGTTDIDLARRTLIEKGSVDLDRLSATDARWFRIVPMHPRDPCGLGHTHHLVPDRILKQGAFPAVVFTVRHDPSHGLVRSPGRTTRASRKQWA